MVMMGSLAMFDLQPGDMVGGYTLVSRLGGGAMGSVWRVQDVSGDLFAMKILRDSLNEEPDEEYGAASESQSFPSSSPQHPQPQYFPQIPSSASASHAPLKLDMHSRSVTSRERLRREALSLHKVHHSGVCAIVDMELDDALAFIVTELIEGRTLREDVAANGVYVGADLMRLAAKLMSAVRAVHRASIVHRDIKPSNVMIARRGPILVDFGISMSQGERHVTRTGLVMGTPGFIAPEIIDGAESDEMTDWWSLASVLAFAATGKPVFGTKPIMAVLQREAAGNADLLGLPPRTMMAFRSALHPDRSERCTPDELLEAIDIDVCEGAFEAVSAGQSSALPGGLSSGLSSEESSGALPGELSGGAHDGVVGSQSSEAMMPPFHQSSNESHNRALRKDSFNNVLSNDAHGHETLDCESRSNSGLSEDAIANNPRLAWGSSVGADDTFVDATTYGIADASMNTNDASDNAAYRNERGVLAFSSVAPAASYADSHANVYVDSRVDSHGASCANEQEEQVITQEDHSIAHNEQSDEYGDYEPVHEEEQAMLRHDTNSTAQSRPERDYVSTMAFSPFVSSAQYEASEPIGDASNSREGGYDSGSYGDSSFDSEQYDASDEADVHDGYTRHVSTSTRKILTRPMQSMSAQSSTYSSYGDGDGDAYDAGASRLPQGSSSSGSSGNSPTGSSGWWSAGSSGGSQGSGPGGSSSGSLGGSSSGSLGGSAGSLSGGSAGSSSGGSAGSSSGISSGNPPSGSANNAQSLTSNSSSSSASSSSSGGYVHSGVASYLLAQNQPVVDIPNNPVALHCIDFNFSYTVDDLAYCSTFQSAADAIRAGIAYTALSAVPLAVFAAFDQGSVLNYVFVSFLVLSILGVAYSEQINRKVRHGGWKFTDLPMMIIRLPFNCWRGFLLALRPLLILFFLSFLFGFIRPNIEPFKSHLHDPGMSMTGLVTGLVSAAVYLTLMYTQQGAVAVLGYGVIAGSLKVTSRQWLFAAVLCGLTVYGLILLVNNTAIRWW